MQNETAYQEALKLSASHYENFPVSSFLIKKELRKDVAIIYWFARTADDIADEGDISSSERIQNLDQFEFRFNELLKGNFCNSFEQALHSTIIHRNLTTHLFFDLLSAFRQDITKTRYQSFDELLDYCKRSADPVGRLILELHNIRNQEAFLYADSICTGLQLTNFYQDIGIDYKKGRIYIPLNEILEFRADEIDFGGSNSSINLKRLIEFNVKRNKKMYIEGRKLLPFLTARLKYEIKWTILGGEQILQEIENNEYEVLCKRPKLSKLKFIKLLLKSLL